MKRGWIWLLALLVNIILAVPVVLLFSSPEDIKQPSSHATTMALSVPTQAMQTVDNELESSQEPTPEPKPEPKPVSNQTENSHLATDSNKPQVNNPQANKTILKQANPVRQTGALLQKKIEPSYPRRAQRRNIEGFVTLKFTVNRNGRTESITVIEQKPRRIFEQAAIDAVAQWQFQPASKQGKAISETVTQTILFQID